MSGHRRKYSALVKSVKNLPPHYYLPFIASSDSAASIVRGHLTQLLVKGSLLPSISDSTIISKSVSDKATTSIDKTLQKIHPQTENYSLKTAQIQSGGGQTDAEIVDSDSSISLTSSLESDEEQVIDEAFSKPIKVKTLEISTPSIKRQVAKSSEKSRDQPPKKKPKLYKFNVIDN
jgi:hypothetical protein